MRFVDLDHLFILLRNVQCREYLFCNEFNLWSGISIYWIQFFALHIFSLPSDPHVKKIKFLFLKEFTGKIIEVYTR